MRAACLALVAALAAVAIAQPIPWPVAYHDYERTAASPFTYVLNRSRFDVPRAARRAGSILLSPLLVHRSLLSSFVPIHCARISVLLIVTIFNRASLTPSPPSGPHGKWHDHAAYWRGDLGGTAFSLLISQNGTSVVGVSLDGNTEASSCVFHIC